MLYDDHQIDLIYQNVNKVEHANNHKIFYAFYFLFLFMKLSGLQQKWDVHVWCQRNECLECFFLSI